MKIGIDVGGVVSKYPEVFWRLINALAQGNSGVEVHFVSDMPKAKTAAMLGENGYGHFPLDRIHEADFKNYGEHCKAQVCFEQGIDVLIDDHMAYLMNPGSPVRLLVMPNPHRSYYAAGWKDDKGVAAKGDEPPPSESKNPPGTKERRAEAAQATFGKFFGRQPETPAVNQAVRLRRNIIDPDTGVVLLLHGSEGTVCEVWEDGRRFEVAFPGHKASVHCRPEDLEVIG